MAAVVARPIETSQETSHIRIASPTGPVTRTILRSPLRDALPSEIPVIDISPIFNSSLSDRQAVAQQVHRAATNTGFFYIKNHGVSSSLIQDIYDANLAFHRQDLQDKMAASVTEQDQYNGYRPPNTQIVNPDEGIDVRESFAVFYEPELDPTVKSIQDIPPHVMKYLTMKDHHFSKTAKIPNFENTIRTYFASCLALARALTRTFALSLDLPEHAFDDKVAYPPATLILNYYPPIPNSAALAPTDPDARVSIGSHTDFQLFTILCQDMLGGLQVLNREGQWINAKPIPDTFVVNIGDCLQRITNDKYVSTVHRAQNWSNKERISCAFFWGFGLHHTCEVLENCVAAGEVKKYEDINCAEWLRKRINDMVELKGVH